MREGQWARRLTAHGTLYRALSRLESAGFLISWSEDPAEAQRERRPMRRLYKLTPSGQRALADAEHAQKAVHGLRRQGEVTP